MREIKIIGFDADDTLWVNESYFHEAELKFSKLFGSGNEKKAMDLLFDVEMKNLSAYGYGIKSFMLSMIETSMQITSDVTIISRILEIGNEMLEKPVEILDGVVDVLQSLTSKYKLIVATKGDLLDQERKLRLSDLTKYFHHIEIMSDKTDEGYSKLLNNLGCQPSEFLMLGNSLKSDIIPVLNIGGKAAYIPFHTTWEYEKADESAIANLIKLNNIREILPLLDCLK